MADRQFGVATSTNGASNRVLPKFWLAPVIHPLATETIHGLTTVSFRLAYVVNWADVFLGRTGLQDSPADSQWSFSSQPRRFLSRRCDNFPPSLFSRVVSWLPDSDVPFPAGIRLTR
jgi:hypothetical protein